MNGLIRYATRRKSLYQKLNQKNSQKYFQPILGIVLNNYSNINDLTMLCLLKTNFCIKKYLFVF